MKHKVMVLGILNGNGTRWRRGGMRGRSEFGTFTVWDKEALISF